MLQNNSVINKGFTLIELMSVTAILGILASLSIPAYNNYQIKAKTAELLNVAAGVKQSVTDFRIANGVMPTSNADAGLGDISSPYVTSVEIGAEGVITVNANQTALGIDSALALSLTPTFGAGVVNWSCSGTGDPTYVPSGCSYVQGDDDSNDTQDIAALRAQRRALQGEIRDLRSQRNDLRSTRRDLQSQRRNSNDPQERADLSQQIQGTNQQIRDTNATIRDKNGERGDLQQQIRDLRRANR